MKEKFKKVYVEITNSCNLNCPFCLKSKRKKESLSFDDFKHILEELKNYTSYLYLHVLGEPLLHENINEFIDYASKSFKVNITTNGYLINRLKTNSIRQINISLHSFNQNLKLSLNEYLNNIFTYEENNSNKVYINYRLWVSGMSSKEIIKKLEEHYKLKIDLNKKNIKLKENVFLNFDKEFIWPQDNKDSDAYSGFCHALTDHIAILSSGVVTACCLDGDGVLTFGNIKENTLESILNSDKFIKMKKELQDGKRTNELCKHCNFLDRD